MDKVIGWFALWGLVGMLFGPYMLPKVMSKKAGWLQLFIMGPIAWLFFIPISLHMMYKGYRDNAKVKKVLALQDTSIKCDNDGCTWTVKVTGAEFAGYVDQPCPQCHGPIPLLTAKDLELFNDLNGFVGLLSKVVGPIPENKERKGLAIQVKDGSITGAYMKKGESDGR